MKLTMKMVLPALLLMSWAGWSQAQVKKEHDPATKWTMWMPSKGTVESIDTAAHKITIKDKNGKTEEFVYDPGVCVVYKGQSAKLADLQPGDSVVLNWLRDSRIVTTISKL